MCGELVVLRRVLEALEEWALSKIRTKSLEHGRLILDNYKVLFVRGKWANGPGKFECSFSEHPWVEREPESSSLTQGQNHFSESADFFF